MINIAANRVETSPKFMGYLNLERQIKKQKVKLEKLLTPKRNKRKIYMLQGYVSKITFIDSF